MSLRLGKLDNDDLERLVLKKFVRVRPEPLSMPAIGQDCATLDIGGDLLVLSCDPITSASIAHLGRLTVHVNCNDAAAAGADPIGLLVTLLVPPSCELDDISRIAGDLSAAAQLAGVDVLGGHTEVTDAVSRPVTSAAVIARQKRGAALPGMRPGDDVVLTKSAAIEGTSIIAKDFSHLLSGVDAETIERAPNFSGLLSVVPESKIALDTGAHAMHDVTEGGVLGALWELSFANGCGIAAESDKIPVRRETAALCAALGLDPLRLIGSGSLLIASPDGAKTVHTLGAFGVAASVVGRAVQDGQCTLDGKPLEEPHADEIYRLYDRA